MTRETRLATISTAISAMTDTLTRTEYETVCAGVGIEAWSDTDVQTGNYKYGDYGFSDDPTGSWRIRQIASQRRESAIKSEVKQSAPVVVETSKCSVCGETFAHTSLMTSPVGVVCPDDYDEE